MISIVIPTFNEVNNIIPLIKNLLNLLKDFEHEIVIVDDDSPDGTSEIVNKYMKDYGTIKLITRVGRSGLASAIKEGLLFAQGKYSLVLDGDGQHDLSCILPIIKEIDKGKYDLIIASRFLTSSKLEGLSNKRSLGSKWANNLSRFSLSSNYSQITDYMSGCFVFKTISCIEEIKKIDVNGFKFLYELLALTKGKLKIKEIPLQFKSRKFGYSKLDVAVIWDFVISLIHTFINRVIPRKAISFGVVGSIGVLVHLAMVYFLINIF